MFIVENEHEIALAGFLIAMVGLHLWSLCTWFTRMDGEMARLESLLDEGGCHSIYIG